MSYAVYDFLAIALLLFSIYFFLRIWFSGEHALSGLLFLSAVIVTAFHYQYYQPWSLAEVVFFTLGLILIYYKSNFLLLLLMIISSLNRETAVYIPLAFLFANIELGTMLKTRKVPLNLLSWFALYCFTWFVVYAGLRIVLGTAASVTSADKIWATDTSLMGIALAVIHITLFMGIFWLFAILGYRKAPVFIRRVSLAIPVFVLPLVIMGILYEVRMFMFLYPLLLGLGLSYLYPGDIQVSEK